MLIKRGLQLRVRHFDIGVASGRSSRLSNIQRELTVPKAYTQLNEGNRHLIYEVVIREAISSEVAAQINKRHSAVWREVVRNTGLPLGGLYL